MKEQIDPGNFGRTSNPSSAIALSKVAGRRDRFGVLFFCSARMRLLCEYPIILLDPQQ